MRIDLRYNVEKTDAETCPFDIEVSSKLIKLDKTEITIGKLRFVLIFIVKHGKKELKVIINDDNQSKVF